MAYHVARLGTLSAAAKFLDVHHATVIRHIDALEARLGCKLFQRHPRGYTPTEAGRDLMKVAAITEDQFTQMAGRLHGRTAEVEGELIVTILNGLSRQFTSMFVEFQKQYPDVQMSVVADERRLRLEYGEAHVALRAGAKPQEPDNVVQYLGDFPMGLFAHKDYVAKYGLITSNNDITNHRFVIGSVATQNAPFHGWFKKNVPDSAIVYRASHLRSHDDAIIAGAGVGVLSLWAAQSSPDLVPVMPDGPDWNTMLWLVTHVDLHRTAKVQAFLSFLKTQV